MSIISIAGVLSLGAPGGGGSVGYNYWRIVNLGGSGSVALSAMLFKDETGTLIPTTGGTAIESGHTSTNTSSKMFDGTDATYWEGSGSTFWQVWAGYNFASPQNVRQIALQQTAGQGSAVPIECVVQYSTNGAAWNTVAFLTVGSLTNDTPKWFDLGPVFQEYPRTDFGTHTYWRMHDVTASGGTWTALSAMLFKDDGGSAIATTGGTALESGHFSTFSSANLFDSNNSTFWESSNLGAASYAGYQFATGKKVMQIALQRAASMDGSDPPTSCRFEFSDDGAVWGVAAWVLVGTLTNDTPKYFNLAGAL